MNWGLLNQKLSYQWSEALGVLRERVDLPAESPARLLRHPVEEGAGEPGEAEGGGQVEQAGGDLTGGLACGPVITVITVTRGQSLAQGHHEVFKLRQVLLAIKYHNLQLNSRRNLISCLPLMFPAAPGLERYLCLVRCKCLKLPVSEAVELSSGSQPGKCWSGV